MSEEIPFSTSYEKVYAAGVEDAVPTPFQAQVEAACLDWAQRHDDSMSVEEMQAVRLHAQSTYDLAARSQPGGGSSEDRVDLEDETISTVVHRLRGRRREG